jgi:hypothetical protein
LREAVVAAFPRPPRFKEDIIQAFYDGIKHKPDTTFGNVKADVLADKDPHFHRGNFCSVIRGSRWIGRGAGHGSAAPLRSARGPRATDGPEPSRIHTIRLIPNLRRTVILLPRDGHGYADTGGASR